MPKTCTKCNLDKPLAEFHRDSTKPDGYMYRCKPCCREYHTKKDSTRTYVTPSTKRCSRCSQTLSVDQFVRDKSSVDGLNAACRRCRRAARLLATYGISLELYETLSQNGCAICGSTTQLEVDHDHACCPGRRSCGKCIRGILCRRHNSALGKFNDDVQELLGAVTYLS